MAGQWRMDNSAKLSLAGVLSLAIFKIPEGQNVPKLTIQQKVSSFLFPIVISHGDQQKADPGDANGNLNQNNKENDHTVLYSGPDHLYNVVHLENEHVSISVTHYDQPDIDPVVPNTRHDVLDVIPEGQGWKI